MSNCIYNSKNEVFEIEYSYTSDSQSIFYVSFNSEKFSGKQTFFLYENQIKEYISALDQMYESLLGNLKVCDSESNSFFCLEYDYKTKSWLLGGRLGGTEMGNFLCFNMEVDQTIIKPLASLFKKSLS